MLYWCRPQGPWKYENGDYGLHWVKRPRYKKRITKVDGAFEMNPSQVVMLLLNCSTTRNNDRRKKMQNRTQLFWQQHWIPWKASHLKRGKPPLGKEQCAYPKEEGHWKKDCPRLKSKKEKNKRRMGTSHIVERGLLWWGMNRPRDSLRVEAPNSNFPTGASGNFDSGGQIDWFSIRYGCDILCGKH